MTTKVNLEQQVLWTSDDITEWSVNLFLSASDQSKLDNVPNDTQTELDGKLDDITEWANISIDKTDPNNPVINAVWMWLWDVVWPASATDNAIPLFNWTTWKILKDSAKTIVTTLWSDDTTLPTSKAVKDVTDTKQDTLISWTNIKTINWTTILWSWNITTWWSWDVVWPAIAVDSNFASFNSTTGKLIKDSWSKATDFAPALTSDENYVTDAEKTSIWTIWDKVNQSVDSWTIIHQIRKDTNSMFYANWTWAVQIRLDWIFNSWTSMSWKMLVEIQSSTYSSSIVISWTYNWTANEWVYADSTIQTSATNNINIRYAKDWTYAYILIWDTDRVWAWAKIVITDAQYNSAAAFTWFTMSLVTSYPSTIQLTRIPALKQNILSEWAFVDWDKTKLDWIATGAEVNVNADWNSISWDSQILNKPTISWTNTGDETTTTIWGLINWATEKTTPVNTDFVWLMDSAWSNILKKLSWLNIKATLKTYLDTLYLALTWNQTIAWNKTFTDDILVPTDTYWVLWSGNESVPTKSDLYDILEAKSNLFEDVRVITSWTTDDLLDTDINNCILYNGSTWVTITIPSNSTTDIPIWSKVYLIKYYTWNITINTEIWVSLANIDWNYTITNVYEIAVLQKVDTNNWVLSWNREVVNLTTAQTVAWVKTFSSDPIVPAEAYWASWNWSNEVPTKNDLYDKIETIWGGWTSFWTLIPWTPTRVSNTQFTITGDYINILTKWTIIKWEESTNIRCAMVISSSYSSPNTTINIVWDTLASFDSASAKYTFESAEEMKFAIAWWIGQALTDAANNKTSWKAYRVIWADMSVWTVASTSWNTVIDINKNWTTMFTSKPTLAYNSRYLTATQTVDNWTSLALWDEITIDIDTFTSTTYPVDLYIDLYIFPTYKLSLT